MITAVRFGVRLVVAAGALAAFPTSADGAGVWVSVGTTATGTPNRATLHFEPGAGETNTVGVEIVGASGDAVSYRLRDASAPLTPGARCHGDAGAGEAICSVPRSRPPSGCGGLGLCAEGGFRVGLDLRLGDGGGSLDLSAIPAGDGGGGPFSARLTGGPAAEAITGSGADDRIDPGPGADVVHAGEGSDFVVASPGGADGGDFLDLGGGDRDMASYQLAGSPLALTLNRIADDGAEREGDNLLGAEYVVGGVADDLLEGSDAGETLDGGGGDDTIRGFGGDDRLAGSEGLDPFGGGSDLLDGGAGDDLLVGGGEADRLVGGSGLDRAGGGAGNDRVKGGEGRDRLDGGDGRDRLGGGPGADWLDGGDFELAPIPDDSRDRLDCGAGRDRAWRGRDDIVRRCERVRRPG